MPDWAYWESFYAPDEALALLAPEQLAAGNVVEFGCGYGTFTLPAARRFSGRVAALDIDPEMIAFVRQRADEARLGNIDTVLCDFVEHGTGLPDASQAHAMIFNLLHIEHPVELLREAYRVLQPSGRLSVMHWRSDLPTPRGPSLAIRPSPEQCRRWIEAAGFARIEAVDFAPYCPYHYGLIALRPEDNCR